MMIKNFVLPAEAFDVAEEVFEQDEMKGLYLLWNICTYGITGELHTDDPVERALIMALIDREE